jgi:F0F1-type ATP synthase membrane subunit b/b'
VTGRTPGKRSALSSLASRVALVTMVALTAWSVCAWAQNKPKPAAAPSKVIATAPTAREPAKGEGEAEGPAPFNLTTFGGETPPFIAMLINFGILAAGYYFLGRKPVAAGLQARRDTISKEIEEAQRMKREAEERAKTYQSKLEKLEEELQIARDSLVRAGEAESERIVREAEVKADRMRRDAVFLVEQELKQLRGELWRDTVEAAVTAAEELLKKRVTPADQERLAEDYLADLGSQRRAISVEAPRGMPAADPGRGSAS